MVKMEIAMSQARIAHEKQFDLSDDQTKQLKQVASKVGKVSKKIGEGGENMGFDDFKVIETCIVKLEERLLSDLKAEQKSQRRDLLKTEMKKKTTS